MNVTLRIICVVPVFATVESNFTTYAVQTKNNFLLCKNVLWK